MIYHDPSQPPGFDQEPGGSAPPPEARPSENTTEPQPDYETLDNQTPGQSGSSWQAPVREDKLRNRWARPLVAGITVVMVIGGIIFFAQTFGARARSTDANNQGTNGPEIVISPDLGEGDCVNGSFADEVDPVYVVSCSEPHTSEVISVFRIAGFNYPSDEGVRRDRLAGLRPGGIQARISIRI